MIQTSVAASAQLRSHPAKQPEPELLDPLLRCATNIESSHALIIAEHGLDLLCALIRRGCIAAATIRPGDKAEIAAYDLILVPVVTALPSLDHLIRVARRSLMSHGRLIVGLPPDFVGGNPLRAALVRRLRLNSFTALRSAHFPGIIVLQADLQVQPALTSSTHNLPQRLS